MSDTMAGCWWSGSPRPPRKYRIGKARAIQAMADAGTGDLDDRLLFIGRDEKGVELEVIAIAQPDHLLVIHVMPHAYRRKTR